MTLSDIFEKNSVEKGLMTLVDDERQQELINAIDMASSKKSGGGSAGNTIVALNQFGGKGFFERKAKMGKIDK